MRPLLHLALGTTLFAMPLVATPLVAQTPNQLPTTLAAMRDHYRPLLVFDGGDGKRTEQQMTVLADHVAEARDRQLLLVGVEGTNKQVPTVLLSSADEEQARRRFRVAPDQFTVILIGKDGGEKLRSHEPLSWQKLSSTIDSMPMRKDEVQGKR